MLPFPLSTDPRLPLLGAALLLLALLLLLRWLRRSAALRPLTPTYLIGTLALVGWLAGAALAQAAGQPLSPTLQHIITAVLIFSWGSVLLRLGEHLLVDRWSRSSGVVIPALARDIVRAVALIVGVLVVLQIVFNIEPSSIVISSTVLSAVIGLALQDLIKNVIAGVALQLERPFDIGHWIQVGDTIGRVAEMSWRATRLTTVDGFYIIYPNADLATSRVSNYSLPTAVQALHTQIALNHVHPPNMVKQVLLGAIRTSPFVVDDPPPSVKVIAYGDYSVTYDLKFWVADYERYPDKRDSVMTNAWYALQRAGVTLPHPVREVYHHEDTPEVQAARRLAHLERVMADLRQAPVLAALADAELAALAERATVRLFGVGDTLVRQGEPGDTLYILRSGRVRVDVRGAGDALVTVNRLGPGDCFGEMALMTGAPRNATIVAEDDTEALLVAKDAIAPLLQANPRLPERLGELLAERELMTQEALARHTHADAAPAEPLHRPRLVERIRQFFGLRAEGSL